MSRLYSHSIRTKLILLFTSTACLTVVIACTSLWIYQLANYRGALLKDESAAVQLVADTIGPALLFDDAVAAGETLASLKTDPRVTLACLYKSDGTIVTQQRSVPGVAKCPGVEAAVFRFDRKQLTLARQIRVQSEIVGLLYVEVSLSEMYNLLFHLAEAGLGVLVVTTLFALTLSTFLQRLVSRPILDLTAVAARVSKGNNYLMRAEHVSEDEIGILVDQFNVMMDRIQERDADLQRAYDDLEHRVRERTKDLSNEILERRVIERDLEAAKVAAEQANLAKSSFLANMSHELRTPLNAIIGYSEMLHEDATQNGRTAMSKDLDKVLAAARHLLSLISDVLDFSKIEAGEMTVFCEQVMSNEMLSDVLSIAAVLAEPNRNTLVVAGSPWQGMMFVDILRFRQALLNLISNACKFTDNGSVELSVAKVLRDGTEWIVWGVRDTGIGISAEDCRKLFHTFVQIDGSSTRRHQGTGLGLAISQQLCQAMGGHITVESGVGLGSTFSVYIPFSPMADALV